MFEMFETSGEICIGGFEKKALKLKFFKPYLFSKYLKLAKNVSNRDGFRLAN